MLKWPFMGKGGAEWIFGMEYRFSGGWSQSPADMKSTAGGNPTGQAACQIRLHSMMPRMEISVSQLWMRNSRVLRYCYKSARQGYLISFPSHSIIYLNNLIMSDTWILFATFTLLLYCKKKTFEKSQLKMEILLVTIAFDGRLLCTDENSVSTSSITVLAHKKKRKDKSSRSITHFLANHLHKCIQINNW